MKTTALVIVVLLVSFVPETKARLIEVLDGFKTPMTLSITTIAGQDNPFYFSAGFATDIFGGQRDLTFNYDSTVAGSTITLSIENGIFFVQTGPGVNLRLQVDYDGTDGTQTVDGYGLNAYNFGYSSTAVSVKARVTNNVGFDILPKDYYYASFYNMSKTFTNSGATQTFTVPFSTMGGTWYQIGAITFDIRIPPNTKAYFRDFATFKSEVKGKVFVDLNKNGIREAGESGYSRQTIKAKDLNAPFLTTYAPSSSLGAFSFFIPPGDYLICANDTLLVPTSPVDGCQSITLLEDDDVTGILLGYEPLNVDVLVSGPSSLTEASGDYFVITVTRDVPNLAPLTVFFSLSGTATNYNGGGGEKKRNGEGDYFMGGIQVTENKFSVVIYPGDSSTTIVIDVMSDGLIEDTEDIVVTLLDSGFYKAVGIPSVTLQIIDSPQFSISVYPLGFQQSLHETFTFTVSLNFPFGKNIFVTVRRGGNAVYGDEYTLSLPFEPLDEYSLLIPAGTTSYTFTATPSTTPIVSDDINIYMDLISPEGGADYTVSYYEDRAEAYVVRDDFKVQVVNLYSSALIEPLQQNTMIRFQRPGSVCPVTIDFTISGTATLDVDYYISSIYGDFQAGHNTVQLFYDNDAFFYIIALADAVVEPTETIIITINPSPYYEIDPSFASTTVTILDV